MTTSRNRCLKEAVMTTDKTTAHDTPSVADIAEIRPFYERWADWIGAWIKVSVICKLIASLLAGAVFFVIHFLATTVAIEIGS